MAGIPIKIYEPAGQMATEAAPTLGVMSNFVGRIVGRSDTMSSDALRQNLHSFLSGFGDALTNVPRVLSGYHIDEIELSLEISASGEVFLLVGSAEMEGKAGVKLTLKRAPLTGGEAPPGA